MQLYAKSGVFCRGTLILNLNKCGVFCCGTLILNLNK